MGITETNNKAFAKTRKDAHEAHHRARKNHWAAVIVSLLSLVFIIPLAVISISIIYFQVNEYNLPGVTIYDQNVGMTSLTDTIALIDNTWNLDRQIFLTSPEDNTITYTLKPKDLGLWVDPQGTAQAAYDVGRSFNPFSDIRAAINGEQHVIVPILYYDTSTARRTLEAINSEVMIPPQEASLAFEDNAWVAQPGSMGQTIDIESALDMLYANAFSILLNGSVEVDLDILTPKVMDLSPVLDDIDAIATAELRLEAYDPITDENFAWQVPAETKLSWVKVDPDSLEVQLTINPDDLALILENWQQSLGEGRSFQDLPDTNSIIQRWNDGLGLQITIQHNPTIYHVSPGESLWSISLELGMPMWHIMAANEGLTINNLTAGMDLIIPSRNILLPLPVIPEKRIVIDLSDQQMIVYENGQVRNTHSVSTGMADSPTMAGIFQVQTHEINAYASNWDLYMPHFLGIYEAWPGFMNGIHGLPLLSSGQRLWASNLGSPASYGCIILDLAAAEDLYQWAENGVVVEIRN